MGGGVRLTWHGTGTAARYAVEIYDDALVRLARVGPLDDTTLTVPDTMLARIGSRARWWCVIVERGGVAGPVRSSPAPFPVR